MVRGLCLRRFSPALISSRAQLVLAVYQLMARANNTATLADAKAINLEMASALNRDISVEEKDGSPDMGGKVSIGSTFDFSDSVVLGVQISGAHDSQWRERVTNTFDSTFPTEQFATRNGRSP